MRAFMISVKAAMSDTYNDKVVRQFAIMTVVWGIVGMAVGVIIAAQLYWPALNFDIPWLTYGRLRPLHTNAVIFAFGGCALMGTSFYVVQRTCHVRLFGDKLAAFVFWGWQAVILAAVISLPLGLHSGQGICGTRMAHRYFDHLRLGRLRRGLLWHHRRCGASSISTWPIGFTAPSSSPSPFCTSSTISPYR